MKKLNRPYRVSEKAVRGVALQVFILSLATILTGSYIPVIILLFDFAIRVILIPQFSPLAWISRKLIVPIAGFRKKQVVFKPKRFAAAIGMVMSALSLFFFYQEKTPAALTTISILALFSFLEAFFKFCAGCKIFGLLMKLGIVSEDECPDCVYGDGSGI